MVKGSENSDSETDDSKEKSSSDELENSKDESEDNDDGEEKGGGGGEVSEYEKQRMLRIKENRERLKSLGLPNLASTLSSVSQVEKKQGKGKGKLRKRDEDEEYRPPSDGEEVRVSSSSSSMDEEGDEEEEEEDDFQISKPRRSSSASGSRRGSVRKGKNVHSSNTKKAKKKHPVHKITSESDYVDDDEALIQAIALSLGDSSEVSGSAVREPPRNSRTDVNDVRSKRKGEGRIKENDGKRKRTKSNTSRVQMSEDQVIIHFFHFDEAGKEHITKKDLQRVATAHDFTWTDKEMADMIHCFDTDGDGKLSLDDFRKIVQRCNMIQGRDNSSVV